MKSTISPYLAVTALMTCRSSCPRRSGGLWPEVCVPVEHNEFAFDTGVLRGKLRAGGKSTGLSSVVHCPPA